MVFSGTGIVLAGIVVSLLKDRIMEFLMVAIGSLLLVIILLDQDIPQPAIIISIITTVFGVWFLTRPIGKRCMESAGAAFLIMAPLLAILINNMDGFGADRTGSFGSEALKGRILTTVLLLIAAYVLNRSIGRDLNNLRPAWPVLAILALAAALFPVGGAMALLVILTGYIIGNRPVAIVGVLLQIYFLNMFYFDLAMSLLHKSILLMVTGLVFLGVWYWANRRQPEART